jgi:type VI secretion system protein ImpG
VVLAERWEHDFSFTEKHLRLNCVPVINLFPLESDPLTLNSLQTEYMLRPMRVQDGHTEIYAVDSVMSSSQHTYVPFSSFRHKGGMMRHEARNITTTPACAVARPGCTTPGLSSAAKRLITTRCRKMKACR